MQRRLEGKLLCYPRMQLSSLMSDNPPLLGGDYHDYLGGHSTRAVV